jgi:lipoate-protein ligase A
MDFFDLTLPSLAENLALDEALLLAAEAGNGGEVLRLWEWPLPAVVLGAACRLSHEVDAAACQNAGVAVQRRASGGGTVLLGQGCLIFSLVLAYHRSPALTTVSGSYLYILTRLQQALSERMPGIDLAGTSDLAVAGRKFSGNAQQRKRRFLLHHGTLLYRFDIDQVGRYLAMPPRQPDYRQDRSHAAFLMNLPLARLELTHSLRLIWEAANLLPAWPEASVRQLVLEKYSTLAWVHRR